MDRSSRSGISRPNWFASVALRAVYRELRQGAKRRWPGSISRSKCHLVPAEIGFFGTGNRHHGLFGMRPLQYFLAFLLGAGLSVSLYAQPPGRGDYRGRGGRGGFDPSSFLKRLDANGNGVIDVEEQKGPAEFMISRLQRYDPKIQPGKPIPLSKITKSFEKARAEREGSRGDDRRDRGDRERESEKRAIGDQAVTIELLVPGFGKDEEDLEPEPLLGFGAQADLLTIEVTETDHQEATSRMRYFDKNKDGVLSKDELSKQFAGDPMDFDRNRDGKLTPKELAVRYAVRREGNEIARRKKERDGRLEKKVDRKSDDQPDLFNGRRSYRKQGSRRTPEGLPGFFADRDANGDGQISMVEFASEWSDEVVAEFFGSDFNRDGVITADEALRGVEGEVPESMPTRKAVVKSKDDKSEKSKNRKSDAKIDSRNLKVAQRIIKRNDKNSDGVLTPSEWKEMLMSPAKSDFNRDGKVTVDEYALWMQNGKR